MKSLWSRGNTVVREWELHIVLERDVSGRMSLLNEIEAECVRMGVIQIGRESSDNTLSVYVRANAMAIEMFVRTIQSKYLRSGETVSYQQDESTGIRVSKARLRVGDVFLIPLPSGACGYAQFLGHIEYFSADVIRVLDLVTECPLSTPKDCAAVENRFPPVLTLVNVARRVYGWKLLGNIPREALQSLEFRHSLMAGLRGPGTYSDWQLWSLVGGWREIGTLPEEFRHLEFPSVVAPFAIAERIESGRGLYDACF